MSYQRNTYGGSDYPKQYGELPKINDKRFSDVIDYSQPRPQSGYQGARDDQAYANQRNYSQQQNGAGRNQYEPEYEANGYGSTSQKNPSYGAGKSQATNGYTNKASSGAPIDFNVQDGQPIQLVFTDPRSGKFNLNQDAAAELLNYEGNISFVTITGKVRTGKSFLLNKTLDVDRDGFFIDPSSDASTQGIWMWSKPYYNERDNTYVFFLDVEGSNNVEKSAQYDAKVFALSVLLSSFFIYNSIGGIDENAISDLSLVTQLARNITISAEESSEHALSYYTPKFIWALRDFNANLTDAKGQPISANQYLESALTDQSTGRSSDTNKKIRQALLNFFKDRDCVTFTKPADDLRRSNVSQVKPEFARQVNILKEKIIAKAAPKQLKGVNLNTRMYVAMLQRYIDALNQGSPLNISNAWEYLVENECKEAYEGSVELYEIALKQFFLNEEKAKSVEDLYNILKSLRDSTLEKYDKNTVAVEKSQVAREFKDELKGFIDEKEQAVVAINEELNQAHNEDVLHQVSQQLRQNVNSGFYKATNIKEFNEDFDHMLSAYDEQGQGLSKTTNLVNFLRTFQPEVISSLMLALNQNLQANQKTFDKKAELLSENEKNLKMNLEDLKERERKAAEELNKLKAEKTELVHKTAKLNEQVTKVKEEEENKLALERQKAKAEMARLREKEKEAEQLSVENKRLLEEMAKAQKKKGCCTIF